MSKSTRRRVNAAQLCADMTGLEATLERYQMAFPQTSIYLELNGRKLFEGATRTMQDVAIKGTAAEAWHELAAGAGKCDMRLYGSNLPELRAMYATWLAALKLEEVGDD